MFGYFDKSPWSPDGRLFLAHRIPTFNTSLTPGDGMQLILLDWEKACRTGQPEKHWRWLTNSMAWNHQQGAMAQWLGPRSDAVIFNDRGAGCRTPSAAAAAGVPDEDTTCSVVVDVATGNRTAVYGMPIYSINYEGSLGLAINQTAMFRVLRGFGHVTPHPVPPSRLLPCSATDGIWLLNLTASCSGGSERPETLTQTPPPPRLLVSLRRAWEAGVAVGRTDAVTGQRHNDVVEAGEVEAILNECNHWINTPQFSKEGEYVAFIYRFGACRRADERAAVPPRRKLAVTRTIVAPPPRRRAAECADVPLATADAYGRKLFSCLRLGRADVPPPLLGRAAEADGPPLRKRAAKCADVPRCSERAVKSETRGQMR
eukprot:XP_001696095.1 predicted protein [Chlamydomonas reinhardtii]